MKKVSEEAAGPSALDWICTALAIFAFFTFILVIAYNPEFFRRPLNSDTHVSIGIASGIVLTIFLVVIAGIYVWLRNRATRA